MAVKLNAPQARVLLRFQDGTYPQGIFSRGDGWASVGGKAGRSVDSLVRLGLLEQQPGNAVYRLTDAGRAVQLDPAPRTYHSDRLGAVTIPEE